MVNASGYDQLVMMPICFIILYKMVMFMFYNGIRPTGIYNLDNPVYKYRNMWWDYYWYECYKSKIFIKHNKDNIYYVK